MTVYRIEYLSTVVRDLKGVGAGDLRTIRLKIEWLAQHAERIVHHPLVGRKFRHKYRIRVGDYRVIYSVHRQGNTILIELIGHRSKVYREH